MQGYDERASQQIEALINAKRDHGKKK
jgi:hypothetical protein